MSRVRMPGIHGYRSAPDLAFPGYRYRIAGGPGGGQYHGFIAPDSTQSWEGGQGGWPGGRSEIAEGPQKRPSGHSLLPGEGDPRGPWDNSWGGTAFAEGETHSDYVYRSPAEMRPRPNASGGVNVIPGDQDLVTAGYAEAPGNYRGLGLMIPMPAARFPSGLYPYPVVVPSPAPVVTAPSIPARPVGPATVMPTYASSVGVTAPPAPPVPYTPGPDMWRPRPWPPTLAPGTIPSAGSGATNVVAQPPPPSFISPGYLVPWTPPPVSPSPAPVVQAGPADFLPSQGQVIDGLTPGTPSAPGAAPTTFTEWLAASTIIPGVANQWIALAGVGIFLMLNSGKGKR